MKQILKNAKKNLKTREVAGYVIANIKGDYDNRMQYYNALEVSQTTNNKDDFLMFIAQTEKESLERYLNIIGQ